MHHVTSCQTLSAPHHLTSGRGGGGTLEAVQVTSGEKKTDPQLITIFDSAENQITLS